MRILALLTLFIGVPLASGTIRPTREAEFWADSGADRALVKRFINNDLCYRDAQFLHACSLAAGEYLVRSGRGGSTESRALRSLNLESKGFDFEALVAGVEDPFEFGQMINHVLKTFDAHARLMPADYLQFVMGASRRDTQGVGIAAQLTGAGVFVRSVVEGSPAARAGLKVGDQIVSVRDLKVGQGSAGERAMRALSGQLGEMIPITVLRRGKAIAVQVRVSPITVKDVNLEASARQLGRNRFAEFRIRAFSEGICVEVNDQLTKLTGRVQGVIIDVRNNTGGLLDEGVCLASLFAGRSAEVGRKFVEGMIPKEFGLNLDRPAMPAFRKMFQTPVHPHLHVVVLINSLSMSASEAFAAAIQDTGRGWIVGDRSFGKGTSQWFGRVPGYPELLVTFTAARFYRPSGQGLQISGVTPNFDVPFRKGANAAERRFPRESEFFAHALRAEEQVEWSETRVNERTQLAQCADRTESTVLARAERELGYHDYQRAFAWTVASCL